MCYHYLWRGTKPLPCHHSYDAVVYADFRDEASYFATAFDLICTLYQLPPTHPAVADLRESLSVRGFR